MANITAELHETLAERDDAHTRISQAAPRVPRFGSNADSLMAVQQDWIKIITEFERQFNEHKKRIDNYFMNVRSSIDEIKKFVG
jgi:hypothetical protein